MNLTVTLTAEPKLMAVLETLAAALGAPKANGTTPAPAKESKKAAAKTAPEASDESVHAGSAAADFTPAAAITEEQKPTFTLEQVRAEVAAKHKGDKAEKVRELLKEFSASKVTDIKKEDYPAFMEKIKAL